MSAPEASADSALSAEAARVAPELYFLVAKFLSHGPLQATAEALRKELEEKKVLPTRLDWEGRTHDQSFQELESQFSHVTPNHLLEVCVQLLRRSALAPRVSLLSRGVAGRHARPPSAAARHDIVSRLLRRAEGRAPWHAGGAGGCGAALLSPRLFCSLELQRRTLGHLSAVYCVMYDRTGNYIITGADDLLVKVWSAIDGRLLMTCRGASSEITDVCVSSDNRLLCAGSLDRHIRVWELQSGAPVAVLQGHSGMITSVHFCPARSGDLRCLVSTSTDGSVAFWTYSQSGQHGKPSFISKPVQYMERMRPGACHMICCCWSPGGVFLAAGSADHHVRVYMMAHEGPKRILEVAAHSDAVDSLAWCHRGLRFVSGSKDGTAILWQLHAMQWRHTTLHMTTCLPGESLEQEDGKRTKVTMVCWDCSDKYIITAASDHTIKVWCARACRLVRVLRGHTDETYVLEAHPFLSSVLLSASHDGQVIVWDMETGERLLKFLNHMEGQGHGAVYDAKWSPDGSRVAATDSHGHLLMWGFGQGHPNLRQLPPELFFHTDYRPLVRDALGGVLDEQTEVPPHLMPPPFLVDVEGAPHPPRLQRLVPGRENLALSQLIPLTGEAAAEAGGPRSHIDRMIALVLRDLGAREGFIEEGAARNGLAGGGGAGAGTVWRGEGVRHTAGLWQRGEPLHNYNCRPLVSPLQDAHYDLQAAASEEMSQLEMAWYRREMRRRPQMISTAEAGVASGPRRRAGRNARGARRPRPPPPPRAVPRARPATPASAPVRSDYYEDSSERASAEATSDTSDTSVRLSVAERFHSSASSDDKSPPSSSSSSSDYSDWVADKPNISLAPPKRSKRRPIVRKRYSPATTPSKRNAAAATPTPSATPAPHVTDDAAADTVPDTNGDALLDDEANGGTGGEEAVMEVELPEPYRPSEWLCAVAPRKAPYHPQMGDECYYLKQGHQSYLEAVSVKDVYKINSRDKPWERTHINECELVKVVGVKYLIRPPRLVCLKLAALQEPHRTFTIKYHDMPDVIDFLVLRQQYDACVARAWAAGDRFRCMIDDMWWTGAVVECLGAPGSGGAGAGGGGAGEAAAGAAGVGRDAARHFLSLRVRWDNGEYERMSPWDLEPIDHERLPTEIGGCMPVLGSELEAVLYRPRPDEWPPDGERARAARHIVRALDQVMGLSIAEPFVAPVDLNVYPSYAYIVEYPIDLSTIKARFENHFYRRMAAAQFDVRYLATNAEKFNQPHSHIVRQARIVTDLLLHIISDWRDVDVVSTYHSLVEAYRSSDSDTAAPAPSTSRGRGRGRGGRGSWSAECLQLMQELMSSPDALPFLQPVSEEQAPDYRQVVPCPMDLGTVRSRLQMGQYARAEHFARDARLVFTNSQLYNTNERSRIYAMTLRMSNLFEELYRWAARAWRSRRRKDPVEEYATSDEETLAATSRRKRTRRGAGGGGRGAGAPATNGHARRSDSWDSDAPLTSQGKGKGVGKKSKPSSAGATQDEASTSRDAPLSSAPSLRLPTPDAAEAAAPDASPKPSSEYEELEVLEEELHEDEVEVTYSGAESASSAPSDSSGGDTYHPPARRTHSHRSRHRVRLKRARKRRRSASDGSRARRPARRRLSKKPSKRRKKKSVGERAVCASSTTSSSPEEAGGAPAAAPARYESDHSYRPRLSSDDSAPLHIYRQTPVERGEGASGSGAGSAAGAGPSRHRPDSLAHTRRSRHSTPHQQAGRSRRILPEMRYNEDSEEDSIAAISKRLREHVSHRSLRARGAMGARSSHTADHNYYNGHAHALRHHAAPAAPPRPHHHPRPPAAHAAASAAAAAHSHYNGGNTSEGAEEEPLSISSRGRVRKLTAKARGLLRD